MRLRPLQDRVLIRRAQPATKTVGGILIPDNVQEKPVEGDVVAVGPGARDKTGTLLPLGIKAGDRCFSPNGRAPKSSSTARTF